MAALQNVPGSGSDFVRWRESLHDGNQAGVGVQPSPIPYQWCDLEQVTSPKPLFSSLLGMNRAYLPGRQRPGSTAW